MTKDIEQRIVEIVAKIAVLDEADVTVDSTLDDLGVDSLGLVEGMLAIEESFGIKVPLNASDLRDSEFDISSVASIVKAVEQLMADQAK